MGEARFLPDAAVREDAPRGVERQKDDSGALARSEASFRALVEHAPDAIGVFRAGAHLYVNPKLAALLGYTNTEMMAKRVLDLIHPDDHAMFLDRSARRERGETLAPAEYRLHPKDGRTVVAEITSINVDYDGGPAVLCFLRDVTDRAQMQQRLVQADRLASVGVLAAGIAHEINNPLAYVMTSLEVLARFRVPELTALATTDAQREAIARAAEAIQHASHGAERMKHIVRDVQTFSREGDDAHEAVDVVAVVDASIQLVSHGLAQRGSQVRMVRELAPVPRVEASESRLGQVFLNLLTNAVQSLDARRADNEVRVRTSSGGGDVVVVEVMDTGGGIAPEVLPRVFDPFFTTKPVGVGTGLGLFVCHGIVTSLGGSLDVESSVGVGTTVRVRLPAARSADPPSVASTRRRARLLLVDDEASFGRALAVALDDEHDVVALTDGDAALELLARDAAFDVVLCDLMMPGTNGMDVWRRASAGRADLGARFVFMTGGAFTAEATAFLDDGHAYLEKPFDLRELRALVRARMQGA